MLGELVDALVQAQDKNDSKAIEKALCDLRKVGVDRLSALIMAAGKRNNKEELGK